MIKTFLEMYNDGWCEHCKELSTGYCSKYNMCKAYEDTDKDGVSRTLIKIELKETKEDNNEKSL